MFFNLEVSQIFEVLSFQWVVSKNIQTPKFQIFPGRLGSSKRKTYLKTYLYIAYFYGCMTLLCRIKIDYEQGNKIIHLEL